MFRYVSKIEWLCSRAVYCFESCSINYLGLLGEDERIYDADFMVENWKKGTPDYRMSLFFGRVNNTWSRLGTVNPYLPCYWLDLGKRALKWDFVPEDFHQWAVPILSSFDLERYRSAYQVPDAEYEAMARDLPVVLEGLKNYPKEKLAPPVDEEIWGTGFQ